MTKILWQPDRIKVANGLLMELDPREWIQMQYIKGDLLEPETQRRIETLLAPGDLYIDVGSHVGLETLIARQKVGAQGLVIAIEPQPYNAAKILTNWQLNSFKNIKLYVAAAGATSEHVWLEEQEAKDRAILSLSHDSCRNVAIPFSVPVVTLKSVIEEQEWTKVKLVKIDVEGFEPAVIDGLGDRIASVENIIFEHLSSHAEGQSNRLPELLCAAGFHLYCVDGEPWSPGMEVSENNLWATRAD